jgi:hypothetical protein
MTVVNSVVLVTQVMQHVSECPEIPDLGGSKLTIVAPRRLQGMTSLQSSRMLSLTHYRNSTSVLSCGCGSHRNKP